MRRNPAVAVAAALAGLAAIIAVAALFDLGPFADEAISAREFITRADAICRDAHEQFRALQREHPQTAVQAQAQTEQLIAIAQHELDAVSELDEPDSLSDAVSRYLAARQRGIDLMERGAEAARDNDGDAYAAAQASLARSQLARERIARGIGLRECSHPVTSRAELERDARPPVGS